MGRSNQWKLRRIVVTTPCCRYEKHCHYMRFSYLAVTVLHVFMSKHASGLDCNSRVKTNIKTPINLYLPDNHKRFQNPWRRLIILSNEETPPCLLSQKSLRRRTPQTMIDELLEVGLLSLVWSWPGGAWFYWISMGDAFSKGSPNRSRNVIKRWAVAGNGCVLSKTGEAAHCSIFRVISVQTRIQLPRAFSACTESSKLSAPSKIRLVWRLQPRQRVNVTALQSH